MQQQALSLHLRSMSEVSLQKQQYDTPLALQQLLV